MLRLKRYACFTMKSYYVTHVVVFVYYSQREEEAKLQESLPNELFSPYSEETEAKGVNQGASISYKQKLMERMHMNYILIMILKEQ